MVTFTPSHGTSRGPWGYRLEPHLAVFVELPSFVRVKELHSGCMQGACARRFLLSRTGNEVFIHRCPPGESGVASGSLLNPASQYRRALPEEQKEALIC